jgi:hypothetical protein
MKKYKLIISVNDNNNIEEIKVYNEQNKTITKNLKIFLSKNNLLLLEEFLFDNYNIYGS